MFFIPYFDNNGNSCESEKIPTCEELADFIIANPHIDGPIFYKNNLVGYRPSCVVLNGKLRRKFTNFMEKVYAYEKKSG